MFRRFACNIYNILESSSHRLTAVQNYEHTARYAMPFTHLRLRTTLLPVILNAPKSFPHE